MSAPDPEPTGGRRTDRAADRETGAAERAFLAHEAAQPWEYDEPGRGDLLPIRWRTLVSADAPCRDGIDNLNSWVSLL